MYVSSTVQQFTIANIAFQRRRAQEGNISLTAYKKISAIVYKKIIAIVWAECDVLINLPDCY